MAKTRTISKTRRANGEGSICQRKDGRWCAEASYGYNPDGTIKRKFLYGKSKLEVINKMNDFLNKITNNTCDIQNALIGDSIKEWLLMFKKSVVTSRTFDNDMTNFNLHIEPIIGNMKVKEVTTKTIQTLFNKLSNDGLGLTTVKKVKVIINQYYNYAIDNGYLDSNPVARTKLMKQERTVKKDDYKAVLPELRQQLIDALEDHKLLKPLCYIMYYAGLRIGETLALRWKDIDFNKKIIYVRQAITKKVVHNTDGKRENGKGGTIISATKTVCSERVVPIPNDDLFNVLFNYKEERKKELANLYQKTLKEDSIIFALDTGKLRTYDNARKIFKRFLKSHNLWGKGIHFHGLRQTYSKILFDEGVNPVTIQHLLGHASVKTSIAEYNCCDENDKVEAVCRVFGKTIQSEQNKDNDFKQQLDNMTMEDIEKLQEFLANAKKLKSSAI